jgi:Carboxypeptidase regulatory-like domain
MNRCLFILLLVSHSAIGSAQSLAVGYRETISVRFSGALAAFSLNDFCAEANAEFETLTVFGKNPGSANIIVVTREGSKTIEVEVLPAPPSYPLGFVLPVSAVTANESGSYESRFTSGPSQSENIVDFMRREGDRLVSFHLAGTFLFMSVADRSIFALSSVFYQILTPGRDITLLDQLMNNSPLTVEGSVVRGFHFRQGNFLFHAGYTSATTFENLVLPSQKEGVVGLGYQVSVGNHAQVTPNIYYFPGNRASSISVRRGAVASLVYDYKLGNDLRLLAEVGFSRGVGAAGEIHRYSTHDRLTANLRYEPAQFASLTFNSLHGFYSNFDWTRYLTHRLTSTFSFTGNHYNLPSLQLTNVVANLDLQFQLFRGWSLISGAEYGRSQSQIPPGTPISTLGVPLGLNFNSAHFQSSFLYQYSTDSGAVARSDEFRATLGTHWAGFRWNGFVDRQTQAMTIAFIYAGVPGLQEALDKLGLSATTPDQIALALSETAGLLNQGLIEGVNIDVNPVRLQAGSDLTWSSRPQSRQRFDLSLFYTKNELLQGENRAAIGTFSYSLKFKKANEFTTSISLLQDGTHTGQNDPLFQISIRRQVGSAPSFIISRRRGTIGGVVFADDGATGAYHPGGLLLPDVEVVLDDSRRTRTDKSGRYTFSRVSYGLHSVEAIYHSAQPFFFTTASRVQSEINAEVNFGVGLSFARLFGSVRGDSGIGLSGIELSVSNSRQRFRARTDAEGRFRVEGLSAGEYQIAIDRDSVPPGYSVTELETQRTMVDPSAPAQCAFRLRAIRNISGRVTIYDRTSQREISVARIRVLLRELSRESVTDENGIYLFRDLPAGSYTLVVIYEGKESKKEVMLPDGPAFPKSIDLNLVAR